MVVSTILLEDHIWTVLHLTSCGIGTKATESVRAPIKGAEVDKSRYEHLLCRGWEPMLFWIQRRAADMERQSEGFDLLDGCKTTKNWMADAVRFGSDGHA